MTGSGAAIAAARTAIERMDRGFDVVGLFETGSAPPRLIHDAAAGRPAYRDRRFDLSNGLGSLLGGLPLMTKADLRRHFPDGFLPPGTSFARLIESEEALVVRTSGTSSDRLQVLWENGWWERQEEAALRRHLFIGPRLDDDYREAVLTTPLCSENVCHSGPVPMEERELGHLLFLNTQHDPTRWTAADVARMLDELERFRPVAIEADPVYLATLAAHLRQSGARVPALGWIIVSYELATSFDKELIREVFGCPVFEFYGLTEAGVFFLECPAGRQHFAASDAVVEVLRPEGLTLPEGCGEIVVTTWGNRAQPLLRYRTGDLGTVASGACPCGVPGPTLARLEGRARDLLELGDGLLCTPRMIDDAFAGLAGLARYQCVQEGPNAVGLLYVGDGAGDPGAAILQRLQALLPGAAVAVERVPFISPEPSGKYRTVVPA